MVTIQERYQEVEERIYTSARSAKRDPDSVKLVVVTKRQPVEAVQAVIEAGAIYLGENYAEEAYEKMLALRDQLSGRSSADRYHEIQNSTATSQPRVVQWHIIGHVQSRKANMVGEHFDYLHSLDSLKLARRLDKVCEQAGRVLPVLIEMNVSGEQTKSGWDAWDEDRWSGLLPDIQAITGLPSIQVKGLMTMAPYSENPESTRPYFQRLRRLQQFLYHNARQAEWYELSMGMSGDFEVAIEEGATWIRVGQAIMGPRPG